MTPVNRKAGTGERTRELPGKRLIFIVLSGFATTDLSVIFRDVVRGSGAYGKRQRRILFPPFPDLSTAFVSRHL